MGKVCAPPFSLARANNSVVSLECQIRKVNPLYCSCNPAIRLKGTDLTMSYLLNSVRGGGKSHKISSSEPKREVGVSAQAPRQDSRETGGGWQDQGLITQAGFEPLALIT